MVACALLLVLLLCAAMNVIVDPFNSFGDHFFHWDAYSQTLSPRNSKAVYLSKHFDEYDSYVIGSSSAASYLPETLEKYYGGHFYNAFHYGADSKYDCQLARYILEHDDVKTMVLVLGLSEANATNDHDLSVTDYSYYEVTGESKAAYLLRYLTADLNYAVEKLVSMTNDTEMPQPFDVFLPKSGTYDKRLRDVESIGALDDYLALYSEEYQPLKAGSQLTAIKDCAANVAEIRQMCEQAGTQLIVILSPVCEEQLRGYDNQILDAYYRAIAEVTDYWNFSITPVTYDERYFYDITHPRNDTVNMVLARIAEDKSVYYPDAFGVYCENTTFADAKTLKESAKGSRFLGQNSATVPILMYHHIDTENVGGATTNPDIFTRQMQLLKTNGFTPISFDDLIAFVDNGTSLPEHPVVITFDDGYLSNYTYAYPVLKELDFCATIFAIGSSIGHDRYYKNTQFELTPHFGQAEIDQMLESGIITIGSHTYDMHQWPSFEEQSPVRENMLPFSSESEEAYIKAVMSDDALEKETFAAYGIPTPTVLSFPEGAYTKLTDVILKSCGYRVTVTTDKTRVNTIIIGLPQSLIDLGRLSVTPDITDEQILEYLNSAAK